MATVLDTPWASRQEFMDRLGAGLGGDYKTYTAAKRSRGVAGDFTIGDLTPYTYQRMEDNGDNGSYMADATGYKSASLDQLFGQGGWSYDPQSGMFRTRTMADPTSATRHPGSWNGTIDPATGRLTGLQWINEDLSRGLIGNTFDKIGAAVTSPIGGPLAVLAAPFAFGAAFGGAGAPAAAAPIVESTPSWVAPGAMSTGTTGAATDLLAGTSLAGSTAAPMMSYIPGMEPITAQSLLAGGAGATVANGVTAADIAAAAGQPELGLATQAPVAPQSAAAAPISASQASYTASPMKMALDAAKPYASLVGPGVSLLGALQAPSAPQDLGPARVPGVEAPPEARGLDRQAARSPILDVLGRNRRENRNRTMLTAPAGSTWNPSRSVGTLCWAPR